MPFQEGNNLGETSRGGRKGYVFEKQQLEQMRDILNKDLALVEEFQEGEVSEEKIKKLTILSSRILKILDKLHASQTSNEFKGDPEFPVTIIIK